MSMQLKLRRRLSYAAIVTVSIVAPAYVTTVSILSTDIVGGSCVPYGVYGSHAAQKTLISLRRP